jgi:hypothetical protein
MWNKKMEDMTPAYQSDMVIVMPQGQIMRKISTFRKVYFFNHPNAYFNNIIQFNKTEEIIDILNKAKK